MSLQDQRYSYLLDKIKCLKRQVCNLEDGSVETDPIFSASPAFGITTPNINSWNSVASGSYITTNTSQTGLTGDKTTSGLWTFIAPWSTGQVSLGKAGEGAKINFNNGVDGTSSMSIGMVAANGVGSGGALINSISTAGLQLTNTGSTGFVGISATGAAGYLNFIAGNTQAARLFANGNLRIGTSTTDDGSKLRVDGNVTVAGNISPDVTVTRHLGSNTLRFATINSNRYVKNNSSELDFHTDSGTGATFARFFSTTANLALQSPGAIPTDDLSGLQLKHTITASSGLARGMNITSTLTSSANSDVLVGLDINPTFVNGGSHTNVLNTSLRVNGNAQFNNALFVSGSFSAPNTFISNISAQNASGLSLKNAAFITGLFLNNSNRTLIQNGGTFTDSGEQLQVVGSTKLDGSVRTTGQFTISAQSNGNNVGLRIWNTTDETTNAEALRLYSSSNVFWISAEKSGTGLDRSLILRSSGREFTIAGSASFFNFNGTTNGNGSIVTINGTSAVASNSLNYISIQPTINQSGTAGYTGYYASVYEQATGSGSKNLIDVGTNSTANNGGTHTSRFSVTNTGNILAPNLQTFADNTAAAGLATGTIYKTATGELRIKI